MANKKTEESVVAAPFFTKAQLTASHKYATRKDLVDALLDDNKEYTTAQVDELINNYLKGQVI